MESGKTVFNDDVLVEVLARLPPESLLRFKSVSPHWRDLLSSPDFLRRYTAAHRDVGGRLLAFFQEAKPVRETWESATAKTCNTLPICKNPTIRVPKHVGRFVNSSNGLILCSRTCGRLISYRVGNPLTRKFVKLPPPPMGKGCLLVDAMETAVKAPHLLSAVLVCEDDNKNEAAATYSVVRAAMKNYFYSIEDDKILYIDSYSSKTGKWSPVTKLLSSQHFYLSDRPAVVANGVIHWYGFSGDYLLVYNPKGNDNPCLQRIKVPPKHKCFAVARTSDGVLWLGLMQKHDLKFYMLLPKHCMDDVVDAKEWVLVEEVSIFTLSRLMKKGLVGCKYTETKLEYLIPECRSEVVAVLRQEEKLFLYNVQRKSLVKVDYSGSYNEEYSLHPYIQSSSLSSYRSLI